MQNEIVNGNFKIQKMDMKGGWHYIVFKGYKPKTGLPFGWFIVKGTIDDYAIKQTKLWPTKDGRLFLPIKVAIRKAIKKQVGDKVHVCLYEDNSTIEIPTEFALCLIDSPKAETFFYKLPETSKKQFVDYIYQSKNIETIANRIAKAIAKLEENKKWHME